MQHDIDPFARNFIREKSMQIRRRLRDASLDQEDIESLLLVDLLKRRDKYDSSRGMWTTFVRHVVTNRVADLLKSWGRQSPPQQAKYWDTETAPFEQRDRSRHRSTWQVDDLERFGLKQDMQDAVNSLPAEDQKLCEGLIESSVSEVARREKMSRGKLYQRINEIREQFIYHDLDKYL